MTYVPLTYVQDIEGLLGELGVARYVAIGTSLGGAVIAGSSYSTLPVVGAVVLLAALALSWRAERRNR